MSSRKVAVIATVILTALSALFFYLGDLAVKDELVDYLLSVCICTIFILLTWLLSDWLFGLIDRKEREL